MRFCAGIVLILAFQVLAEPGELTAAPPPTPLTLEAVAANPQLWPREVITKVKATGTLRAAGQPARAVTIPAGELVRLIRVERTGLKLEFGGAEFTLTAAETDLMAGAATRQLQFDAARAATAAQSASLPDSPAQRARAIIAGPMRSALLREGLWFLGLLIAAFLITRIARRALGKN